MQELGSQEGGLRPKRKQWVKWGERRPKKKQGVVGERRQKKKQLVEVVRSWKPVQVYRLAKEPWEQGGRDPNKSPQAYHRL